MGRDTKRKLHLIKIDLFAFTKYIEKLRQDEKHVLDLLEAIMRPTDSVKEALRPFLFNMSHFRSAITQIRVGSKS